MLTVRSHQGAVKTGGRTMRFVSQRLSCRLIWWRVEQPWKGLERPGKAWSTPEGLESPGKAWSTPEGLDSPGKAWSAPEGLESSGKAKRDRASVTLNIFNNRHAHQGSSAHQLSHVINVDGLERHFWPQGGPCLSTLAISGFP